MVALALVIGGVIIIAVAIYLGATITSALYLVALVGLSDFVFAWAYATGRMGPLAQRRAAERSGDVVADVEADPTYNPYARED